MSYILFPEPAALKRYTGWQKDADGFVTGKDPLPDDPIEGSFQPVTSEQITVNDLQGQNVELVVYIDTSLYTTPRALDEENQLPADEIVYEGDTYRVKKVNNWRVGIPNAEAFLVKVI